MKQKQIKLTETYYVPTFSHALNAKALCNYQPSISIIVFIFENMSKICMKRFSSSMFDSSFIPRKVNLSQIYWYLRDETLDDKHQLAVKSYNKIQCTMEEKKIVTQYNDLDCYHSQTLMFCQSCWFHIDMQNVPFGVCI